MSDGPGIGTISMGVALGMTLFYGSCHFVSSSGGSALRSKLQKQQYTIQGTVVGEQYKEGDVVESYRVAVQNKEGRFVFTYMSGVSKERPVALSALLNPGDRVELTVAKDDDGELMGLDAKILE